MKSIFIFTITFCLITCSSDSYNDNENKPHDISYAQPSINAFFIRLIDENGNWIEDIEEKDLQLLFADSQWNILEPFPKGYYWEQSWGIIKQPNLVKNDNEEELSVGEGILCIGIYTDIYQINDGQVGDYLILKIDEDTSVNIQLLYVEKYNRSGLCIEKIIIKGQEYFVGDDTTLIITDIVVK